MLVLENVINFVRLYRIKSRALDWNQIKKEDFEVFNNKGLHFMHLNINGLLNKIDELRYIARSSNAAVIGITETKLGNTVYDSEVTVDGYNIVRNDRNRNGGGVACYIRNSICFNRKNCLPDNIENIFIDLFYPKTKPISVGIIYKPPKPVLTSQSKPVLTTNYYSLRHST